ncbi:MAG: hypothetical protein JWM11_4254 [Planctomycetaceae bacterium]|nr:hypothetical protein [Planctomycetaceae bacterium]
MCQLTNWGAKLSSLILICVAMCATPGLTEAGIHGQLTAASADARSSVTLNPHLVGKLVDILTIKGESFVRVKVLDTDEHFIYVLFQNREHEIPWAEIHNIQFSR